MSFSDNPWTDEDVERAARALYGHDGHWTTLPPQRRIYFTDQVRRVLDALATRTSALKQAAKVEALRRAAERGRTRALPFGAPSVVWPAELDAWADEIEQGKA